MENTKLTFTPEALDEIAKQAIVRKTGARGLRSIMEKMLMDTMYEIPDMDDVEEVILSGETVKDGVKPLYVRSDAKKKKKAEKEKAKEETEVVANA